MLSVQPPELWHFVNILVPAAVYFLKKNTGKAGSLGDFWIIFLFSSLFLLLSNGQRSALLVQDTATVFMVPALICQHKRGKIEGLLTADIFHRPLIPATQGQHTLSLLFGKPAEGEQVLGNDTALSEERFKGQRQEKAG